MSAHDTADEVEAMASGWELVSPGTAAMLRRLHKRAVDAERERYALQDATARHHLGLAELVQVQVDTARADALREAAALSSRLADDNKYSETTRKALAAISSAILALIERGTSHAE